MTLQAYLDTGGWQRYEKLVTRFFREMDGGQKGNWFEDDRSAHKRAASIARTRLESELAAAERIDKWLGVVT